MKPTLVGRSRLSSASLLFTFVFSPRLFCLPLSSFRRLQLRHGALLAQRSPRHLTWLSFSARFSSCIACNLYFVLPSSSAVPPKPAHLLALGQDKKPKRIPPAPSRPLPAPPPPPKPKPGSGEKPPQKEAQKVGLLIERFENSRYCRLFPSESRRDLSSL